jgi:hypothetical protein
MPLQTTLADETESFAAQEAIASTLERYVDGARHGDTSLLRSAFAADARVSGSYGGKPVNWTLQEFCDVVEKGGPATDLKTRVVAIEYMGTAAMARLEAENWRGTRYTDFFVLTGTDGTWRIDSKVFFAHSRA